MRKLLLTLPLAGCMLDTPSDIVYVDEFNGHSVRVVDVSFSLTRDNMPAIVALAEKTCKGPVTLIGKKLIDTPEGVIAPHVGHLFSCD